MSTPVVDAPKALDGTLSATAEVKAMRKRFAQMVDDSDREIAEMENRGSER